MPVADPDPSLWPDPFRVEVRFIGSTARVTLTGELDLLTAPELERALERIAIGGAERVVLDLRALAFLDSTGLALILRFSGRASEDGSVFELVRGRRGVQRVFAISGVEDQFVFLDSPDDLEPPGLI
jgi:anti-sigma B factor antagonist